MTRPKRLNATFVKAVRRPGRYGDGRGGLGPYPVVTLADARKAALENRRVTFKGGDPRAGATPTFAEAAQYVVGLRRATWRRGSKSEAQWKSSLRTYAFPVIGNRPVDSITTAHVLSVLTPIWNEKRITAQRLRGRISYIMKWCIGRGYRHDDPAGDAITAALPHEVKRKQHFRALPHAEVAGALAKVRTAETWPGIRLAFQFQVLTAARAAEVRRATWSEIDWEQRLWTVPAEHMKAALAHVVQDPVEAAYRRTDLFEQRRSVWNDGAATSCRTRRDESIALVSACREPRDFSVTL